MENSLIETLIVVLIVSFVLIALGILVIIILVVVFFRYKQILRIQRRRAQQVRINRRREIVNEEIVEPETDHHEALTHGGVAPPGYEEAIISTNYRSVSIESLNQLNMKVVAVSDVTAINLDNDTGQTVSSPPPYVKEP